MTLVRGIGTWLQNTLNRPELNLEDWPQTVMNSLAGWRSALRPTSFGVRIQIDPVTYWIKRWWTIGVPFTSDYRPERRPIKL